jgi:hypothetical protein
LLIASRATRLFGRITMLPAFVQIFVARQVISRTVPSKSPTVIQWPTRNGFSI